MYSIAELHYLSIVLFIRDIVRISFVALKFNRRNRRDQGDDSRGSSGGRKKEAKESGKREKEREKFAEKCEGLFWRPCRKHSFFPLLLHFLLVPTLLEGISRRRPASMCREKFRLPGWVSTKIFFFHRVRGWMRGRRRAGRGGMNVEPTRRTIFRWSCRLAAERCSFVRDLFASCLPSCQSE